jgi:hypothetical protein
LHSVIVVSLLERTVNRGFRCFHELAADDHLVQDLVHFVKVEDQVQLAHTSEVLVEHLHEQVNELKDAQFILVFVNA